MRAPISWIRVRSENVYTVVIDGKGVLINPIFMLFNKSTILTTVTKNPDVVTEWIRNSSDGVIRRVGFEVEFDKDDISRIGTVQLCVGNRCLVFQLTSGEKLPPSLAEFLGSWTRVFVGPNIVFKMDLLREQFPFSEVVSIMEMGHYVPLLRDMKEILLDSIELGDVQHEWAPPTNLSHQQVQYATLDAFLNIHIAKFLWNVN